MTSVTQILSLIDQLPEFAKAPINASSVWLVEKLYQGHQMVLSLFVANLSMSLIQKWTQNSNYSS